MRSWWSPSPREATATREVVVTASTLPAAGTGRARALRAPIAAAGAALAATTYVGLVDPNQSGHYPTCPFLFITGYYCPGCGSLRAVHALTHGDVGAAVGLNVLTVVGIVLAATIWGRWALRSSLDFAMIAAPPAS